MMSFSMVTKPLLVVLIMSVFIIKLLLVSIYQQRSGDYFSNKMFHRYSKMEIINASVNERRRIMVTANWLNLALWTLSILLMATSVGY